ncbi:response regulator [Spirosoma montaniterrae]|uniref:Response regulatory domain-containing protein n=1 Tax=Spirosoma montaniterrae TaxID=1178516 RepID=A0A1P9X3K7_9BACT|nr:response regulator [Spirosoma montaniterrae]AQG82201.1 hypothetical protein AWR27_24640 [Spirosoma montaniterrae]
MNAPTLLQTLNEQLQADTPVGRFIRAMLWTILTLIVLGLVVVAFQPIASRVTSFLLSLACLLLGIFTGFLFGIPRVLQADGGPATPPAPAPANSSKPAQLAPPEYRQQVNTNLEQISDWLTKIIVGLGLVNLYKIPDLLRDTSTLIAAGIALPVDEKTPANPEMVTIFANALILYFPILGFLVGYLITRIFLSGVFRQADTGELMTIGGQQVALADVVKNLVSVASANLTAEESGTLETTASVRPKTSVPTRILWVDDTPGNNVVERETLTNTGVDVVSVESTADALSQLAKREFDLVITDMGRTENGSFNATAGVDLIKQVNAGHFAALRTIVYTSKKGFDQYGELARQAGADDIVYSPRILMKSIGVA